MCKEQFLALWDYSALQLHWSSAEEVFNPVRPIGFWVFQSIKMNKEGETKSNPKKLESRTLKMPGQIVKTL